MHQIKHKQHHKSKANLLLLLFSVERQWHFALAARFLQSKECEQFEDFAKISVLCWSKRPFKLVSVCNTCSFCNASNWPSQHKSEMWKIQQSIVFCWFELASRSAEQARNLCHQINLLALIPKNVHRFLQQHLLEKKWPKSGKWLQKQAKSNALHFSLPAIFSSCPNLNIAHTMVRQRMPKQITDLSFATFPF